MRLGSIAAGLREVCEKQLEKHRYTASERLSPIDKLSLRSGNPAINGGAQQDLATCARPVELCVCMCVCVYVCVRESEREKSLFEMQSTSRILGSSFRCKASLKRHSP
ncbi:hypothetical protein NL108_012074 [Boleophthalmus pectinirostris]|nr:hypothetical protein NL108_012074 [Boleophthalmus pectinirostris]